MPLTYIKYPNDVRILESADDNEKIVGIIVHGVIYTGFEAIERVKKAEAYDMLVSLAHAKFMVACDLGNNWKALSEQPTIICADEEGPFLTRDMVSNVRLMKG